MDCETPAVVVPGAISAAPTATVKTGGSATALAPGFRFHPTDEELVSYYLKRKVSNKPVRFNAIAEVDIYKHEPSDLAEKSLLKTRDQEYYFYSFLDKKYGNGARMNRATNQGYWKATGKDREVRHNEQVIGMKKTLVYHSGRAPDGSRTNWVMHEYRLVDEELERIGALQMEKGYALCRVFHKNNIGPPSGNRYAPFVEEEWDDGSEALIPGVDAGDDVVTGNDAIASNDVADAGNDVIVGNAVATAENFVIESNRVQRIGFQQGIQYANVDAPPNGQVPRLSLNKRMYDFLGLPTFKIERSDGCPPLCMLNRETPLPLLQYKKRRPNDLGPFYANFLKNSTRTTQDGCSSTTKAAATAIASPSSATTTAISALLEFSLLESIEPKEKPHTPPSTFDTAKLDLVVPPGCMKLINELQNEIHKISVERETLKLEIMSAQAMINILQSRIEYLCKENDDLKINNRGVQHGS